MILNQNMGWDITRIMGFVFTFFLAFASCKNTKTEPSKIVSTPLPCIIDSPIHDLEAKDDGAFIAKKSASLIQIDGCNKDAIWSQTNWYAMNYLWMGNEVDATDYFGKFKLAWDDQYLYILAEITDDILTPTLESGLENFWKGDYIELFIDEDKSGGDHKFNHQAFAYHVSTEGHVIDKNIKQETAFFDDHMQVARSKSGNNYLWEMAIKLFDSSYNENATNNIPVKILAQKSIGFSIAYGDNDGRNRRENFMGSKKTHGVNNDEGYTNASVFGRILFVD